MKNSQTYLCPFCDEEAAVGAHCPTCVAIEAQTQKSVLKLKTHSFPIAPLQSELTKNSSAVSTQEDKYSSFTDARFDPLDVSPEKNFKSDDFIEKEFCNLPPTKSGVKLYWWLTAFIAIVILGIVMYRIL